MEKTITNNKELNEATVFATNHIYEMCNTKDLDQVIKSFTEAKDFLIAIYKYNVLRLRS